MLVVRQAYGCDCDGVSHLTTDVRSSRELEPVRSMTEAVKGSVEKLTGYRPESCPWRAFYEPLVRDAVELSLLGEKGLAAAALGSDAPAILIDAVAVYERAKAATYGDALDQKHKELESKGKK